MQREGLRLALTCTVTPRTPVQISDDFWTGTNRVQATVVVKCPGGTVVTVDQRVYEATPQGLTQLARAAHNDVFVSREPRMTR